MSTSFTTYNNNDNNLQNSCDSSRWLRLAACRTNELEFSLKTKTFDSKCSFYASSVA